MCVCVCVCVFVCVCVVCVCVCVCVGYWPREKLLQHAQLLVQQGCGVRQEGPECGLVHPSLVHLFVGLVLIATFGLFGLFFSFSFLMCGSIRTCLVRCFIFIAILGLLPLLSFFSSYFFFFFLCVWSYSHLPSAPGLRFWV